jgi:hypothetical protein
MPLAARCRTDGSPLARVASPGFGDLAACPKCGAAAPYRGAEDGAGLIAAYLGAELVGRLREQLGLSGGAAA